MSGLTSLGRWWSGASLRVRLGWALAAALAPVLILSMGQSALSYRQQAVSERLQLITAARRGAEAVRFRMEAGEALVQSLAPSDVGGRCAARLAEIRERVPSFANLVRFDADGRVLCAASATPEDPLRGSRPWFQSLAAGADTVIASDDGVRYASAPSLLASARSTDASGNFTGAVSAVMTLASLRPGAADSSLPPKSQVALIDSHGRFLSSTDPKSFPPTVAPLRPTAPNAPPLLWFAHDRRGEARAFTAAPLVGNEVWVLLSAPSETVVAWAWLNPISALLLPILAFGLALGAVWMVADSEVVRWIAYLRRIAGLYARGRFGVHPVRAAYAPPEIRELAQSLDGMATAIASRDAIVKETLAHKDVMMREIHHRVKNNLQVISSLLNMQQRNLVDPSARAAIFDTRQRISALALIYRALYQGADLRRVDLGEFLEELTGQLLAESGRGVSIRTELKLDPLTIDPDRLAPLALFAVEAITNARKHGLVEGGLLVIHLTVEGSRAVLEISDSGAGPGVVDAEAMGKGVGRTLMTAFARQLQGEATLEPNANGGLTTRLVFPTPAASAEA